MAFMAVPSGRVCRVSWFLQSSNGFISAARQALDKLGVKWEPAEAERAYNERRSTQVPVNPVVRVKGRFSRQLRYGKSELVLER